MSTRGRRRCRFRSLAHPAVHFVLGGAALFLAERWWSAHAARESADPWREPIVISALRLEELREEYARETGAVPSPAAEEALVARAIDDEILYRAARAIGLHREDPSVRAWLARKMRFVSDGGERSEQDLYQEALALGLDRDDVVVRRILVQKMRLLAEVAGETEPSDAELQAYLEVHRERWTSPPRVSLWHLYLSRDRHGPGLEAAASDLLAWVRDRAPEQTTGLGDPFPLGRRHVARTRQQLESIFGPEFAAQAMAVERGRWHGPVPSAYGLHLIYVDEKRPAEPASLDSVRNQVSRRLIAERRQARLESVLARLRQRHAVEIDRALRRAAAFSAGDGS